MEQSTLQPLQIYTYSAHRKYIDASGNANNFISVDAINFFLPEFCSHL